MLPTHRRNICVALANLSRLITPLTVGIGVTVAYALFVVWRVHVTGFGASFFVVAGPPATDPGHTPPNLYVFSSGATYDGQFFYRLAIEPWTNVPTAYGITLDLPAYRQQRIVYPLLAWTLSTGAVQMIPMALIVVNLLAIAVLTYTTAIYATRVGRSAVTALLVPLYPGYVVSISRDLAELTEAALLVTGLTLLGRRRFWWASAALTAGALAKETLLGVPAAGVIAWAVRRARQQRESHEPPLMMWVFPLLAYAVWSLVMLIRWGSTGFSQGSVNFGQPLDALAQHVQTLATPSVRANLVEVGVLVLVVGVLASVVVTYRAWLPQTRVLPLACLLYAGLAVFYKSYVWQDYYAYLRALHELFLTGCLALLTVGGVWTTRVLGLAGLILWIAFAKEIGPAP